MVMHAFIRPGIFGFFSFVVARKFKVGEWRWQQQ